MTYRAIGFDYGGVIGGVNSIGGSFTAQACDLLGISSETYKELYFSLNHKINLGEIDNWYEFWRMFLDRLGKPEMLRRLSTLSDESFAGLMYVEPKMLELVDHLRETGYKVGLLSNATLENGRQMRKLGIDQHFDAFLISAEIKCMKPEHSAFNKLADSLNVPMNEMIFIDDAEKSLSTADECGFEPVLFEGYQRLLGQLNLLDIRILETAKGSK